MIDMTNIICCCFSIMLICSSFVQVHNVVSLKMSKHRTLIPVSAKSKKKNTEMNLVSYLVLLLYGGFFDDCYKVYLQDANARTVLIFTDVLKS